MQLFNQSNPIRAGRVVTDLDGRGGNDTISDLALQSDGRIIVAGATDYESGTPRFSIGRYSVNGIFDESFNGGEGCAMPVFNASSADEECNGLAVQPDNKIIAAGYSADGNGNFHLAMCRLTADGLLDSTFGTGGKVYTPVSTFGTTGLVEPFGVTLQPDGKILTACEMAPGGVIARYTASGALDTDFNGSGFVYVSTLQTFWRTAVQSDGKILAVGQDSGHYYIYRYSAAGALDTGFGTAGIVTITTAGFTPLGILASVGLQSSGKIIFGGSFSKTADSSQHTKLARFNTDGSVDSAFGTSGQTDLAFALNLNALDGMTIATDDSIYGVVEGNSHRYGVFHVHKDGAIDTDFGDGGLASAYMRNTVGYSIGIAITPADKIVVGGWVSGHKLTADEDWGLAQWTRYGELDPTFGSAV